MLINTLNKVRLFDKFRIVEQQDFLSIMTDVKDVVLYVNKENNEFRFYPTGKCFINGISNHYDGTYPDEIKNIV